MRGGIYFVLMMGTLAVVSCLPDPLEVKNIPQLNPKIVVSTHMVPGESLLVLLARSFNALDANDDSNPEDLIAQVAVPDAIVIIKGPVESDTLLNLGNGFYGGINIDFQEGETYELLATHTELGTVRATTRVQQMIDFESLETELAFNGYDDTLIQVTYKAFDPPGKNQYIITVQRIRRNNLLNNLLDPNAFTKLVTDEAFDGKEFGETFRAWPRNYTRGDTVAITMTNISEDYYRYLLMRQENRFSFTQFLGEPINYTTNVQGGFGYFNLNQPAVRFVVLE